MLFENHYATTIYAAYSLLTQLREHPEILPNMKKGFQRTAVKSAGEQNFAPRLKIGQINIYNGCAVFKGVCFKFGNTLTYGNIRKANTILECALADFCNAIGNYYALKG